MDNFAESVAKGIADRKRSVVNQIVTQWKGVKPFGARELSPKEEIAFHDSMSVDDIRTYIEDYGIAEWQKKVARIDGLRMKHGLGRS